jgi:hypothetical protein
MNWGTLSENHYQEEVNPQIIYSPAYQQLYSHYQALKEHHAQQRAILQRVPFKICRKSNSLTLN